MTAELPDLDERFAAGDFAPLREWLAEHVHRFGRRHLTDRDARARGRRRPRPGALPGLPRGQDRCISTADVLTQGGLLALMARGLRGSVAMTRRSWLMMGGAAAVWGASYMFIKVALDDFSEGAIVCIRTALGAVVLLALARRWDALAPLRGRWPWVAAIALVQVVIPFLLITFGENHIDSQLAGILVSAAPIFTALLALAFDHDERSHGLGRGRDRRRHARGRPALRAGPLGQQRPGRRRPHGPGGQPLLRGRRDAPQAQAARRPARRRGRRPDGRGGDRHAAAVPRRRCPTTPRASRPRARSSCSAWRAPASPSCGSTR